MVGCRCGGGQRLGLEAEPAGDEEGLPPGGRAVSGRSSDRRLRPTMGDSCGKRLEPGVGLGWWGDLGEGRL